MINLLNANRRTGVFTRRRFRDDFPIFGVAKSDRAVRRSVHKMPIGVGQPVQRRHRTGFKVILLFIFVTDAAAKQALVQEADEIESLGRYNTVQAIQNQYRPKDAVSSHCSKELYV